MIQTVLGDVKIHCHDRLAVTSGNLIYFVCFYHSTQPNPARNHELSSIRSTCNNTRLCPIMSFFRILSKLRAKKVQTMDGVGGICQNCLGLFPGENRPIFCGQNIQTYLCVAQNKSGRHFSTCEAVGPHYKITVTWVPSEKTYKN